VNDPAPSLPFFIQKFNTMPTDVRSKSKANPAPDKQQEPPPVSTARTPNKIETLFEADKLQEAMDLFLEFLGQFDLWASTISLLKGRLAGLETEKQAERIGHEAVLERNKISFAFQSELLKFRKDVLAKYFDIQSHIDYLNSIRDRDDVMGKILDLRLLPKHFQRDEKWEKTEGNSSIIYRLYNPDLRRHAIALVIKLPQIQEKLKLEIGALADLRHRNIIKLLDFEVEQFPYYVITEFVYGENLPRALKVVGKRPPAQVADWMFQLTDALNYLRHKRIFHTNVRPSKIYIDDEWQLMISPFDIMLFTPAPSRSPATANADKPGERTFSRYLDVCQYGSPELLRADGNTLDFDRMGISDMYSIGLIGYKMLTGKDLFEGKTLYEILENRRILEDNATMLEGKLAALPADNPLTDIIRRLLRYEAAARQNEFRSLHELLRALTPLTRTFYEESSLIRQSYRRCLANNREFIRDFYKRFFEMKSSEGTKYGAYFNQDAQRRQSTMLQMAVDLLIDLDDNRDRVADLFGPNASKHSPFKVADYENFLKVLLECIRENDQVHWNKRLATEWNKVHDRALQAIRSLHT